jgi:hypothetical protein
MNTVASHPLEAIDQQPVVRRRLVSAVPTPISKASSDAPPVQQQFRHEGRRDVQRAEFGFGR